MTSLSRWSTSGRSRWIRCRGPRPSRRWLRSGLRDPRRAQVAGASRTCIASANDRPVSKRGSAGRSTTRCGARCHPGSPRLPASARRGQLHPPAVSEAARELRIERLRPQREQARPRRTVRPRTAVRDLQFQALTQRDTDGSAKAASSAPPQRPHGRACRGHEQRATCGVPRSLRDLARSSFFTSLRNSFGFSRSAQVRLPLTARRA